MAIKRLERCKVIPAPAVKIRDIFNRYFQSPTKTEGTMNWGYTVVTSLTFDNISELNANHVYIYDAEIYNSPSGTYFQGPEKDRQYIPEKIRTKWTEYLPDSTADTRGINNLRGYLVPHTVSEFVSGGDVRISRIYNNSAYTNNYSSSGEFFDWSTTPLFDTAQKKAVDNLAEFADYIVPQIHWYYEDDSGTTQTNGHAYYFWYFFAATGVRYKEGESLLTGVVHKYKRHNTRGTDYFAFSPPYIKGAADNSGDVFTGGVISGETYVVFPSADSSQYRVYTDIYPDVPYVMLGNYTKTISGDYLVAVTDKIGISIANDIFTADPLPNGRNGVFPAYKSVDDVIALFADYGIKLYTNIDDALTPPPSTDGVVNPDNPSEPAPYYPDNSTDTTPIEQAYITPSTFGQSCVYTPLTTKDFLRWICDNTVNINNWSRLFANPVDVIMGINLYNLDIVAHDAAHVAHNAQTNILGVAGNIPNYSILDGYNNIVDGGTLTLQAYYGNYADYTSMTYQLFIPFVGFTSLRACDVVNHTLHLYYAVDFATGSAVAFVNSDDKLIYSSPCNVAGKIPVSTSDKNSQMINNTLSGISAIGGLLGGIASGNVGGGVGALLNGLGGMQMQTNYANKGGLSAVNIYKLLPAFVERTRYDLFFPSGEQQYLGAKYQSYAGAPSTQFDTLLNCVNAGGFVQSDVVYLTSQTATDAEKDQIISLIKSGIYL